MYISSAVLDLNSSDSTTMRLLSYTEAKPESANPPPTTPAKETESQTVEQEEQDVREAAKDVVNREDSEMMRKEIPSATGKPTMFLLIS